MGLGSQEMTQAVQLDGDRDVEVTVEYDTLGAPGLFAFRVGCRWMAPADLMDRAVAIAGDADVAVVVVGTSNEWESEGFDRESLVLPAEQDELVRRVAAANSRTVVVVNTGAPVTMPWADDVGAVLQVWFGGQEMAQAIADVLVGDEDPGGRLPVSLPVRLEDTPAFGYFPGERNELRYGEGLFVGYRWYEARRLPVTFPFGHGLSYSTFALGEPELSTRRFAAGDELVMTVPVTNSGTRAGTEVVQCYVAPPHCDLVRPQKELKAFGKIRLDAGQAGAVTLVLSDRAFSYWDPGTSETQALRARVPLGNMVNAVSGAGRPPNWRIDSGQYVLHIGRSSADIAWKIPVTVKTSSGDA
jgi:beta-glucosidase